MKNLLFQGIMLFACVISQAQTVSLEWVKQFGSNGYDGAISLTVDAIGNVYTLGRFQGTVDFDSGPGTYTLTTQDMVYPEIFIVKHDSSGNFIWAKQLKGHINEKNISLNSLGNIVVTGTFYSTVDFDPGTSVYNLTSDINTTTQEIFIMEMDVFGNFNWAKKIDGKIFQFKSCVSDITGNIFISGTFTDTMDANPGSGVANLVTIADSLDIFIISLDVAGNYIWAKQIDNVNGSEPCSVNSDHFGNLYVSGTFKGVVDFNPSLSVFNLNSVGNTDDYILKLDISGNFIWAKQLSGTFWSGGTHLTTDVYDNIYITGILRDTMDLDPGINSFNMHSIGMTDNYLVKLNANGDFQWAKQWGETTGDYVDFTDAIESDSDGSVYVVGRFFTTVDFDPSSAQFLLSSSDTLGFSDIFISKFDGNGNFQYAKQLGGSYYEFPNSIYIDGSKNIYTTGSFYGMCDFDPGMDTLILNAGIDYNVFIHKMSQQITVSLKKNEFSNKINVFPNPTSQFINIDTGDLHSSIKIIISDVFGKIIDARTLTDSQLFSVSIEGPNGVYFVSLLSDKNEEAHIKVIKQ